MLVVGFEHGKFEGKILAELRRLREHDIIRMVDLLFVTKDEQGDVAKVEHSDLSQEEAMEFGALAGALLGLGARARKASRPAPKPARRPPRTDRFSMARTSGISPMRSPRAPRPRSP